MEKCSEGQSRCERELCASWGPAEAWCFRLKGYYRFHFQLQSPSSAFLHQVLRAVVPTVRLPREVDLTIDIDPQDMVLMPGI